MEILNGVLSNPLLDKGDYFSDVQHYVMHEQEVVRLKAKERIERLVRSCYCVADIVRKVRLSTFE